MAQVPYSPAPDVVPTAPSAPRVNIQADPGAFGVGVAQAEQRLGEQGEQSANQLAQTALYVQQLRNDTWAKDDFVRQAGKIGDADEWFRSKKGADAAAAYPEYKQRVMGIYQDALTNAPNPQAKRMLGDVLSRRVTYSIEDAGRHAGEQQRQYNDTTNISLVARGQSDVAANPRNDQIFSQAMSNGVSAARALANSAGDGEEGYNKRVEQFKSSLWETRLRAIGFDDPKAALTMFDANKDQIKGITQSGDSYQERIKEWLQRRNNIIGADQDAESILHPGDIGVYNDKTLTPAQRVGAEALPAGYKTKDGGEEMGPDSGPDYLANALKRAREVGKPYGAEYTSHLIAQVKNKYNDFYNAYRLQENGTFAALSTAITGNSITDRNTLFGNPVLNQQFDELGQTATGRVKQQRLLEMIDKQSQRGTLPAEQQRSFLDRIRGFEIDAERDPAARDEFFNMFQNEDLYSKVDPSLKGTLSSELDKLRRVWAKTGQTPGADRATEAIASLKPMMDSAGIRRDPNNKAVNNQYYEAAGAISAKIEAQEALTGKPLTDKEINDLAIPIIQRVGGVGQAVKNNGGIGAPLKAAPQASM